MLHKSAEPRGQAIIIAFIAACAGTNACFFSPVSFGGSAGVVGTSGGFTDSTSLSLSSTGTSQANDATTPGASDGNEASSTSGPTDGTASGSTTDTLGTTVADDSSSGGPVEMTTGAVCGDGVVDVGEGCDDGNMDSSDECTVDCQKASCGDGYVRAGVEMCDSGEANGEYGACNATCSGLGPHCGDGITQAPYETCDDVNNNTNMCCGCKPLNPPRRCM